MYVLMGWLLLFGLNEYAKAQFVGKGCVSNTGIQGECTYLVRCPASLHQLNYGVLPKMCGYDGTQAIVCCTGLSDPPSTTPKITLITRKPAHRTFWQNNWRNSWQNRTISMAVTNPTAVIYDIDSRNNDIANQFGRKRSEGINGKKAVGDISQEKCKEYTQYAYEDVLSLSPISRGRRKIISCPFEKETLIVGGTKASRQEFPHRAQLGYKSGNKMAWLCAGSIISPKFILTAAHCLTSTSYGAPKWVRVGITNQSETNHAQIRNITEIVKHPTFASKYDDIGLVRVDQDFMLDIYARPACLNTKKTIDKNKAIASGWGKVQFAGENSEDLLKVVLERFTVQECNDTFRKQINKAGSSLSKGILDDSMICYGSRTDRKDTCQSLDLDTALYESLWYEQSLEVKKCILIMMMRSQRPLLLNIGPFYPMTTSTAVSTLKASYSYVALLRTGIGH